MNQIAISGTEYPYRPIEEIYDIAKYVGVSNLELWIPHNFEYEHVGKIRTDLEKQKLHAVCVSTWTQLNLPGNVGQRQALIIRSIKAAKELGASIVNTYFGAHPDRTPQRAIQLYKENIALCVEFAEKENITIVLENEFDITGVDPTRKAEYVLELVETVNSPCFRLTFDACNFYFAGEEPYPYAYNLLKKYIAYVHIKDGTKYHKSLYDYPGDGFLWQDKSANYICCELGKGAIPYSSLIEHLRKDGYNGYFTMEPHVHPNHLKEIFKKNVRNTIQALKQGECK
ncbi:MAG: sugar phosphate isomerase/epimerase family protein [Candidatus Neomarinimicrobiota bacterium]